ncbi:uncharacterized protein F5147DRAFT_650908 [Suillus discolor]|uniref:Uncharacterized protein n=1 Tax=Suillus discolor TaxID=1912936 RepID=A0A9P7FCJ2_9AGAM|nr:uncharacterized protein F5147DRAFT_650908 [Suillus discolor]KAG2112261.1 hypothetical protein F5147DRAFT_650908 [Suillus discolor]
MTSNRHVHFELPTNGDTPSNSPISNTGNQPSRFNFGFENLHSHLTADLARTRRTIPQTFNFGFPVQKQVTAEALVPDPACQTALMTPQPQKFNFGFTATKQGPAAVDSEPTPSSPAPTTFNFGWTRSIATEKPPVQASQPFNFGMNVESEILPSLPSPQDVRHTRRSCSNTPDNGVPASVIPLKRPMSPPLPSTPPQAPAAKHTAKFNFGWKQPPSTTAAVATHVGFDQNNKPFQFSCKVPPAKVGKWTLAPITAAVPQAALVPMAILAPNIAAVPEAAPAPESDPYTPKALPNWEGGFPTAKRRKLDPANQVTRQDTIGRLIGDAEKAAIDIVKWLNGDEFDRLAQTMLGSLIRPGDDVRDPMPEDVLDSNCAVLSVFCESRDWLTRIFKDLITLHHASEHHIRQISFMDSLANEVETAERTAGTLEASGAVVLLLVRFAGVSLTA